MGIWDVAAVSTWDGSTELGPAWNFTFPTIITVTIAGDVNRTAGGISPAPPGTWPPYGLGTNHDGGIGYRLADAQGSHMEWPSSTVSVVKVQNEMRPVRAAIAGAQPDNGPNVFNCGFSSNPRWACYTYVGEAHLSFVRAAVGITLKASDAGTTLPPDTVVMFTAGMTTDRVSGIDVDMSEITWRWRSEAATTDSLVCVGQGRSCPLILVASGTMRVGAYVNGLWQEETVSIKIQGSVPPPPKPCLLSSYPEISTPQSDSVKKKIWTEARLSNMERGAHVTRNNNSYTTSDSGWVSAPCGVEAPPQSDSGIADMHVHLRRTKVETTKICNIGRRTFSAGDMPSKDDWADEYAKHSKRPGYRGYILYQDKIREYEIDDNWLPIPHWLPRCGY